MSGVDGGALLARPAVQRVAASLKAGGAAAEIRALAETARTAQDAANALGCPVGAIVKSLVFAVEGRPVMALVAGDRQCDTKALGGVLQSRFDLSGKVGRADADLVRAATGFTIGGVAPVAHAEAMPIVLDASLRRFDTIWAAAGHPHCVFSSNVDELLRLSGAAESDTIGRA
ncbi:YbaK/EbsC family protein [Marinibaculum pumilum]|uniref:YbaK/EbsC family protein n=1 Tax=Marinibaculum pumilum TaxID=1766165 RepID=A0ABV7L3K7_9PROT